MALGLEIYLDEDESLVDRLGLDDGFIIGLKKINAAPALEEGGLLFFKNNYESKQSTAKILADLFEDIMEIFSSSKEIYSYKLIHYDKFSGTTGSMRGIQSKINGVTCWLDSGLELCILRVNPRGDILDIKCDEVRDMRGENEVVFDEPTGAVKIKKSRPRRIPEVQDLRECIRKLRRLPDDTLLYYRRM